MRDFDKWFATFKTNIRDYSYYVDFEKVHRNVEKVKVELNILNSLIGSKNIEKDFEIVLSKYPETIKCIPILLAVREKEIDIQDNKYNFNKTDSNMKNYKRFMAETGLFDLLENHIINNLIDYVTGVETGLDTNGRKNRGGYLMENLIEEELKLGKYEYKKEATIEEIERKFSIDLSAISNKGKTVKRFDFVVKTPKMVYGVETNFYSTQGSKLNETARSYKNLAIEAKNVNGFKFIWFTDGKGWNGAKNNLKETFEIMEHLYNISDIEHKIMKNLFV